MRHAAAQLGRRYFSVSETVLCLKTTRLNVFCYRNGDFLNGLTFKRFYRRGTTPAQYQQLSPGVCLSVCTHKSMLYRNG